MMGEVHFLRCLLFWSLNETPLLGLRDTVDAHQRNVQVLRPFPPLLKLFFSVGSKVAVRCFSVIQHPSRGLDDPPDRARKY